LSREQLEEQTEQLQASSEEDAKRQLKMFFIMDKVAEKLDIEVSEEELNGHIAQLAIQQGQRPEKVKEEMTRTGSLATFSLQIREEKCIEKLLESAKITEIKPAKKAKKAKKNTKETVKKTAKKAEPKEKKQVKKSKKTTKKKTAK
jgi:trigger factor